MCAADLNGQDTVCSKVVSFAVRRFHFSPCAVNLVGDVVGTTQKILPQWRPKGEQLTEAVRNFKCLMCGFAGGLRISICWARRCFCFICSDVWIVHQLMELRRRSDDVTGIQFHVVCVMAQT